MSDEETINAPVPQEPEPSTEPPADFGPPQNGAHALKRVQNYCHYNDGTIQWEKGNSGWVQSENMFMVAQADTRSGWFKDPTLVEILSRSGLWNDANIDLYKNKTADEFVAYQNDLAHHGSPSG